jgi:thiosulfate/3-mercaptopyruvate sulfurtransferase
MQPLVSADWLAANAADVRIVDSRWYVDGRSGRAAYDAGHIPTAVWVDLDRELAGPATARDGRHPLPSPAVFATAMSRLGIGDDTSVVVYDDAGGSIAARLWWLLRVLDHPVAVLDGGIASWTQELSRDEPKIEPASFTVREWPSARFIDAPELLTMLGTALVLDARSAARYAGRDPVLDPRAGHIPGARSAPWAANIDTRSGRFASQNELREHYVDLGAEKADAIVAYCGSGVTACHDLLALEIAGFGAAARLYTGSWSQWGADSSLPAETV